MSERKNIIEIRASFAAEGYLLLTSTYYNNKQPLSYKCPKGHVGKISWSSWDIGVRCQDCCERRQKKYSISEVSALFASRGFTLNSTEYKHNKERLSYTCPVGHIGTTSLNCFLKGSGCYSCGVQSKFGENSYFWKGGLYLSNIPAYDVYSNKLSSYIEVRYTITNGVKILQVPCIYCGVYFTPTITEVNSRLLAITTVNKGENHFYCSTSCKKACPSFKKRKYLEGYKPATSREVQPSLRKLVFKRDSWTCQKCGDTKGELHCHHIDPVIHNPIESADLDNCITFCKKCHKEIHKDKGCRYYELKCKGA